MDLEIDVLEKIKSSKEGVLQSELWKVLGIDSRKCSRIVTKLEDSGLVTREWETHEGTRTFRIKLKPESDNGSHQYHLLVAGDMISPCVGCSVECKPSYCEFLSEWIYRLFMA